MSALPHAPRTALAWILPTWAAPGLGIAIAGMVTGQPMLLGAVALQPALTLVVLFGRLAWIHHRAPGPVLSAIGMTLVVLVPIFLLLATALLPGVLLLAKQAARMLGLIEAGRAALATLFGGVTGLAFMAMVAIFHHSLIPSGMPRVPGWAMAHLLGGVAGGVMLAAAALVEPGPRLIDQALALALIAGAGIPHGLLTWLVWLRTLESPRERSQSRTAIV